MHAEREAHQGGHGKLHRLVNGWWERLFSVIAGGSWDNQPQLYESGQSRMDYLFNTLGSICWGVLFPLLTVVATQFTGVEQAGEFTLAFTTASLLLYIGNYGVKTYQISDLSEIESFSSYRMQRFITCALMMVLGCFYCLLRGYDQHMWLISMGCYGFRAVDALADVYEARLQQIDKLYLAGISTAVRSIAGVAAFTLLLLFTRSLEVASIAMAIGALASLFLLTVPLTILEAPRSRKGSFVEVREIFVECFHSFIVIFLFNLIQNVPKYAMEGTLSYDSQIYFSALAFPAQSMLMIVGFIYRPQLLRIATIWSDPHKRVRFDFIILVMIGVCVLVTLGGLAYAKWLAVPLNGFMYSTDFEPYRKAQYLIMIAGGFAAAIDFLYQILTVLREQAIVTRAYVAATVLVAILSVVLVRVYGFDGSVYAFLAVMAVLFVALVASYVIVRMRNKQ